jgi:Tol biopolymer transport system component
MHRLVVPLTVTAALALAACGSGNDTAKVAPEPKGAATAPAGLPTGHLLYRRYLNDDRSRAAIYAVGPGETNGRAVTNPPEGALDEVASGSPDGSRFAFTRCSSHCELYTARADGSGAKRLFAKCDGAPPACPEGSDPVYSPDGHTIVYGRAWGRIKNDQIQHADLFSIPATGGTSKRLTSLSAKGWNADVNHASFSPDGKRLVFEVIDNDAHAGHHAVFVMNARAGHARRLTPWSLDGGDFPRFSPDGSLILFRAHVGEGPSGDLFTMSPDGSGRTQLTHSGDLLSGAWSPDGDYIAYAKGSDREQPDIWVMRADGSDPKRLTDAPEWDSGPTWGP